MVAIERCNIESESATPFFGNPQNFVETFRRNVSTTTNYNAIARCSLIEEGRSIRIENLGETTDSIAQMLRPCI
jgi:hypothetical protein